MEEKKPTETPVSQPQPDPVEAILVRIPVKKVLSILFVVLSTFLAVEAYFIWSVLDLDGLNRVITTNGAVVIVGGLLWACIFTLVFVWPMKIMSIEGLRLTFRMQQDMKHMGQLVTDGKSLIEDFKKLLPEIKTAIADGSELVTLFKKRDFAKLEEALNKVVSALGEKGEVPAIREELRKAVAEFGGIVAFIKQVKEDAQKAAPEVKEKLNHVAKTLDALADYFEVRV